MDEQDINATAEADGNLTITRADDALMTCDFNANFQSGQTGGAILPVGQGLGVHHLPHRTKQAVMSQ